MDSQDQQRDEVLTRSLRAERTAPERAETAYLLVLGASSSSTFTLPPSGEVVIGRTPDATLCVPDPSVSRAHARLTVSPGEIRIRDLGSRNGTLVNGEPVRAERVLLSGDAITLGDIALVLHRPSPPWAERTALDAASLARRLEEELERSLRYQRPLLVLSLLVEGGPVDRARALLALRPVLRLIDAVAFAGDRTLLVVLPESSPAVAPRMARRLCDALASPGQVWRAGIASCPDDGCDADSLLSAARAASAVAPAGGAAGVASTATTLEVGGEKVVVADPAMVKLFALLEKLAASDLPVLLRGETGTGKEIAARLLHERSPRRAGPFVALNCAAIPEALFESELFGHERGAFTGATSARRGHFEAAHGGTLFLDEIGDLPLPIQAKLLRVLESRRFLRLGDQTERSADVRFVAATHKDLEAEVKAGRFRQDLLFRLNAARVLLPPLRERRRELPLLARALLQTACARLNRPALQLSPLSMQRLQGHGWPGNIRELRNTMDYVASTVTGETVHPWDLPEDVAGPAKAAGAAEASQAEPDEAAPLTAGQTNFRPLDDEVRELERDRMLQALRASGGQRRRAAELIGMPRRTFATKLKLYDLASEDLGE